MSEEADQPRCCVARRETHTEPHAEIQQRIERTGSRPDREEVFIAGGNFNMGDAFDEGYAYDGETPVHDVEISPFYMDATCVTNADFLRFVDETSYFSDAERIGNSAVFYSLLKAPEADIVGHYHAAWWLGVLGADWRHPYGAESDLSGLMDHPVVHVTHGDALAYCAWAGRDLPTEAEWEYAARGGHHGRRFPWGDLLEEGGRHHANVWQGAFPHFNAVSDGWIATAPVREYAPNSFGLYQMVGNVWEWCSDWFERNVYSEPSRINPIGAGDGTRRVMRGGSYLCHESYCSRYRVSARSSNTPDSSSGNLGFRTVRRA